jgi:hypothetical protein
VGDFHIQRDFDLVKVSVQRPAHMGHAGVVWWGKGVAQNHG